MKNGKIIQEYPGLGVEWPVTSAGRAAPIILPGQDVRHLATWATDANGNLVGLAGPDAAVVPVANLGVGIVDATNPTTINNAVTIPNAFPASYLITDSGTPADYVVTLPAAAPIGALVYFRVARTATRLFTLWDGGTLIDGLDRRILWRGETAMLLKVAGGWTKVGGQSIPMTGALIRTTNQSLTATVWQGVAFGSGAQDPSGLNLCFDSANGWFVARRAGVWRFTATLPVSGVTAGSECFAAFSQPNTDAPGGSPSAINIGLAQAGLSRITHNLAIVRTLARTDTQQVSIRPMAGSAIVEYVLNVLTPAMTYEEVITW